MIPEKKLFLVFTVSCSGIDASRQDCSSAWLDKSYLHLEIIVIIYISEAGKKHSVTQDV